MKVTILAVILVFPMLISFADMAPAPTLAGDLTGNHPDKVRRYQSENRPEITDVSLIKEELYIDIYSDFHAEIRALFWFEGTPNENPLPVYFPATDGIGVDSNFVVEVNGEQVVLVENDHDYNETPYEWVVEFEDGKAYVEVQYSVDFSRSKKLAETLNYSLITGAEWAGSIGELDIYLNAMDIRSRDIADIQPEGYSTNDYLHYEWHFTDYEPDENISIVYFKRGGYELWAAESALRVNGYDTGIELCEKAIEIGDNDIVDRTYLLLANEYYFEKGEYDKALSLITKSQFTSFEEDKYPYINNARLIAALRCELMLGKVEADDYRLKHLMVYGNSGGKYHKSLAQSSNTNSVGLYFYLNCKNGASNKEKLYFLNELLTISYYKPNIEGIYKRNGVWERFIKDYPDSKLLNLARFLNLNTAFVSRKYKIQPKEVSDTYLAPATEYAEIAKESEGLLSACADFGAANCYIFAGDYVEASNHIERLVETIEYETSYSLPYIGLSISDRLLIPSYLKKKVDLFKSSSNEGPPLPEVNVGFIDRGTEEYRMRYMNSFLSNRLHFYLITGDRELAVVALEDYEKNCEGHFYFDVIVENAQEYINEM